MTPTEQLHNLIDKLSASRSTEGVQDRLHALEKILEGEESLAREGAIPHTEAKKQLMKWLR
jgi:hypothetical protein